MLQVHRLRLYFPGDRELINDSYDSKLSPKILDLFYVVLVFRCASYPEPHLAATVDIICYVFENLVKVRSWSHLAGCFLISEVCAEDYKISGNYWPCAVCVVYYS